MATNQILRTKTVSRPVKGKSKPRWIKQISPPVLKFVERWIDLEDTSNLILRDDASVPDFSKSKNLNGHRHAIASHALSIKCLNDIMYLDQYLKLINETIETGGYFIGRLETTQLRKTRILARYIWPFNHLYYVFDYLIFRVWAKMPYLQRLYRRLFGSRSRAIPEMEALGRLYFSGFSLLEKMEAGGNYYFAVKKLKPPEYNIKPSCGPLIRLQRNGKNGKTINVYKLRTMFTYAQFLQQHVYEQQGLASGGKIKKDPRVNAAGFILRKYWLDEIPMLINLLKGDLKIIGVRPLSKHYLGLYPKEVQQYRLKFKPGLIPPFYADLPGTLEEIVASEVRYLQAYERQPLLTDLRVCYKAFYNIVFRKARSL